MHAENKLLKDRATERDLSRQQIADAITGSGNPISRAAVEHWLDGRRTISLFWFGQMAAAIGLTEDETATGRAAILERLELPRGSAERMGA